MNTLEKDLSGHSMRIGIVQSRFNPAIGDSLRNACIAELHKLGVADADITLGTVPGALEAPLLLLKMAKSRHFDALIALGAVIRGETYHFEIVANESARGIIEVQLDTGVPIANAILTTENDEQALARAVIKGAEAAHVAIEMANLIRHL
ncbi:MAG: 6,7-dimethyl-8-ribityllumazine synthase [Methylophilales bacterium]|nr:6,7-dimethyl-8-ribityllumazine synthase [Methylophilales bacterium]